VCGKYVLTISNVPAGAGVTEEARSENATGEREQQQDKKQISDGRKEV